MGVVVDFAAYRVASEPDPCDPSPAAALGALPRIIRLDDYRDPVVVRLRERIAVLDRLLAKAPRGAA